MRTNRASRLKTPLWLGALLLLAGCAAWTGLSALNDSEPEVVVVTPPSPPHSPLAVAAPEPSAQPDAAPTQELTQEPSRVPVLDDVGGYPVMARLTIEAIGLELPVIEELGDEALKTSPCLYAGPSSPQDAGNIVLVGHNYRRGSHFGRLNELKEGDAVLFIDKYGGEYHYTVSGSEIIKPDETGALDEYEGDRALSLLTCTPSGEERLLVRCRWAGQQESRG